MTKRSATKRGEWMRVVFAADCKPCDCCDDLRCHVCGLHYADCDCPGPMQDDLYEYREVRGVLWARVKGAQE